MWFGPRNGEVTSHSAPQLFKEREAAYKTFDPLPVGSASRKLSQHYVHVKLSSTEDVRAFLSCFKGFMRSAVVENGCNDLEALEKIYAEFGCLSTRHDKPTDASKQHHVKFGDADLPSMVVNSVTQKASDLYKFIQERIARDTIQIANYPSTLKYTPRKCRGIVVSNVCALGQYWWDDVHNHAKMLVGVNESSSVAGLGDLNYSTAQAAGVFWIFDNLVLARRLRSIMQPPTLLTPMKGVRGRRGSADSAGAAGRRGSKSSRGKQ
eukprot:GEMP01054719.1.p1 GENE.GEMP01054719.1~~GEMP01054719.1.p1  ORF type:complete len:265 (+),score=60.32 GEMP01054719.1:298-1092(+)